MALIILIHAREGRRGSRPFFFFFFFSFEKRLHCHQAKLLTSLPSYIGSFSVKTVASFLLPEVRQSYNPVISCLKKIYSVNDEDHGYFIGRNFSITSFICFVISDGDILSSFFLFLFTIPFSQTCRRLLNANSILNATIYNCIVRIRNVCSNSKDIKDKQRFPR